MTRRVAWLPAGGPGTASSRLRAYLPCRALRRAGWRSEVFEPARGRDYDAVVFQKKYDPAHLELARDLRRRGTRVVFDLCDNHFHYQLDQPAAAAERSRQLERMIAEADLVTVSTPTLGEVVRERTGRETTVIDDMVEPDPLRPFYRLWGRLARGRSPLRLVWFGSAGMEHPPFGLIDLGRILPLLEELARATPATLTVISNSREQARRLLAGCRLPFAYHGWSRRRFPLLFAPHHVAVVPISRNPFTLCKTANRPALSLLLGVPVVADAIPGYQELADFVVLSDWERGLRGYAADPGLRRDHAARGRLFVRRRFDPGRITAQWMEAFERLLR